jgi:hypothetical protein
VTAIQRLPIPALSAVLCFTALNANAVARQETRTPRPEPTTTRPAQAAAPRETPTGKARLPQGFSVVLVLGDIQTTTPTDDVPPAARKALTDMRDFLPYKSFRLLDAAWLLCCGNDLRRSGETTSQLLRGPEGQEYELKLTTSRESGGEFVVRFSLFGASESEAAAANGDGEATLARRLADARDRLTFLQIQLQEARKKYEVGTLPKAEVTKLEMEMRSEQRRVEDLTSRQGRGTGPRMAPSRRTVLDTTFTMDVGETVVVGTSRLKGGSRALIALLTAVPSRGATTTVRD